MGEGPGLLRRSGEARGACRRCGAPDKARPWGERRRRRRWRSVEARQTKAALAARGRERRWKPLAATLAQAEVVGIGEGLREGAWQARQGRRQPAQKQRIGEREHDESHAALSKP